MASTISNATLEVNISESLSLGGTQYGGTKTLSISGINEVFKRIVKCVASQTTTIATFNGNAFASDNAIDLEDAKYIRVSNLSTTADIEIGVAGAASNYSMLIPAGNSHIISRADNVMLAEADAVPTYGSLADITKLEVRPTASTDVNVEIFVATV